ncbi:hypothetical protein [Luteipulveratus mongoliensis]|uniref:Heavy metal-binding domain-containing protein n=1 Tax=Luteipulveratus mongoliensis TaxID=571913 RepID=A0A0K1JD80_9MICO|nr:hypothetical protein [Luteipulveratus mongoliensis]AKU14672.1 hypothetical protein VV02_00285 [Luteipulveratus mongoliensis]
MNALTKVGGFAVGVAAVFGVGIAGGHVVGPVETDDPPAHAHDAAGPSESGTGHAGHGDDMTAAPAAAALPGGLQVAQDGYRLALTRRTSAAGRQSVSFTITGPKGRPVTAYDTQHDKQLHLIAVRRDMSGFQHVHPTLAKDGRWSTNLDLTPGQWRVFADFKATGGPALTLGQDLDVAGAYQPAPEVRTRTTTVVDGYTVRLTGALAAGKSTPLTLSITKAGKPVNDLQPYLGAYGHLVALRAGDLAYLHVHPEGEPGDGKTKPGPNVTFMATAPSVGDYRLYLDFKHGNTVRTAELALPVGSPAPSSDPTTPASDHDATPHTH